MLRMFSANSRWRGVMVPARADDTRIALSSSRLSAPSCSCPDLMPTMRKRLFDIEFSIEMAGPSTAVNTRSGSDNLSDTGSGFWIA